MEERIIEINAKYDQTIQKEVRNKEGEVTGHEDTNHHFTFGKLGSPICGGLYINVKQPKPEKIVITIPSIIKE